MQRAFLFFLLCSISLRITAQTDSTSINFRIQDSIGRYRYKHRMDTLYFKQDAVSLKYAYNGGHSFSVGYNISRLGYMVDFPEPTNRIGPTVSIGGLLRGEKMFLTSTFSFSGHFYFIYGNVETTYFTNFKKSSMFVSPEIGITLAGIYYIGYSKQISLFDHADLQLKNQLNVGAFIPIYKTSRKYFVMGKRAKNLDRKKVDLFFLN